MHLLAVFYKLLFTGALAFSATIDLPIHIQNTYSSVEFQVGTPPKPYRLLFDTGSASSWIVNSECANNTQACPNPSSYERIGYNPEDSSTSVELGPYSYIPYLDGDGVGGTAFQDAFAVSGSSVYWNQTFLSANQISWRWITADGFLGLAFSSIAETNTSTIVETLLSQYVLDQSRFSIFYGTNLNDTGVQNGILTLGGSHENTYVDGEVKYIQLRTEDPYQVWRTVLRSITVTVDGTNTTLSAKNVTIPTVGGDGTAVFDTGAGRVSLPSDIISGFYYALGWNLTSLLNGSERMECQHLNSSWALHLNLGSSVDESSFQTYSMYGNEFVRPGDQCMPPVDDSGGQGFALIGAAFLRRFYSVWDLGGQEEGSFEPRLGFGKLKREWDWLYQ